MSQEHKQVVQHSRPRCYFCGSEGPIETHHIIPQRHSGSDDENNLVDLCPTCHERLERLYDKKFYKNITEVEMDGDNQTDTDEEKTIHNRKTRHLLEVIGELEYDDDRGASIFQIRLKIQNDDKIDMEELDDLMEKLCVLGEIYETHTNYFRVV